MRVVCTLLALVLGGCAANEPERQEPVAEQESLEQILAEPLDADDYVTPRRCISRAGFRDFEAIGDRHVLFHGPGGRLWLNELRSRCPGLARASALAFEEGGHQLCELDRFRTTDLFGTRDRHGLDGLPCTLGRFVPVSEEQVDALRAALEN